MNKTILFLATILCCNYCYSQSHKVSVVDSITTLNKLLDELPNSRRLNDYVKYKVEYIDISNEIKLFCQYYELKTNLPSYQYNVSEFKLEDIDPNAIVIRPYNSTSIMLQLIVKNNELKVVNSLFVDGKNMGGTKLDRASIDFYDSKECKSKLERIKEVFTYIVKSAQLKSEQNYSTDTSSMKLLVNKSGDNEIIVDLTKIKGNQSFYVFGAMEKSPIFLNSNTTKESEVNARNYLIEKAKKEKHKSKGKVFIQFIIDENGKIKQPKVLKGVNKELDALSIKLVNEMPTWIPGSVDGKSVSTKFTTNIVFD